jgi:hypothetical protein
MIAQISCLVLNGKGLVTTSTSPALTCSCIRSQNDQAQACWICTYTTSKVFIHPLIRLNLVQLMAVFFSWTCCMLC